MKGSPMTPDAPTIFVLGNDRVRVQHHPADQIIELEIATLQRAIIIGLTADEADALLIALAVELDSLIKQLQRET